MPWGAGTTAGGLALWVLTFGAVTQNNATHVSGTPTWVRITDSADVFVGDLTIGTDMTFSGTVATGTNVTLNASTFTEGNP